MQQISANQLPLELCETIFPARLEWLCQPEQIEYTLHLLYDLNSWKKASQQLLYADRQGLQEVQALILARATLIGTVQATTYIDGTRRFPGELRLTSVAEDAARGVLTHMQGLHNPDIWPPFCPDGDTIYKQFIRPFYKRITGKDYKLVADAKGELDLAQIRDYIQKRLHRLIDRAKATRTSLPLHSLSNLCIAPVDLLHIRDNRIYFLDGYDTWGELDESDLCKLDPKDTARSRSNTPARRRSTSFIYHSGGPQNSYQPSASTSYSAPQESASHGPSLWAMCPTKWKVWCDQPKKFCRI